MLYIVSTPIGNLKDFSERGKETLAEVDIILCEDTRVTRKLLENIGVEKKLITYNDHTARSIIPNIINSMKKDITYALVSDAGTPLISDPGFKLINACIKNNIKYTAIPGACSVITALVLSGQATNRFLFDGFAELQNLEELSKINSTIILFESANRINKTLENIKLYFDNRTISIVREITKIFEEVITGDCDYLLAHIAQNPLKGEIVIVISSPLQAQNSKLYELKPLIEDLKDKISTKTLSEILSKFSGLSKNSIYNFIEKLKK
ncbi:MAG: 16S rRNA (cytidine(1402)-2'-O)-methyltransferase [Holosporales bacterium]|nr:16S rRNA (cytidine(1402)-2'-O)-methyltransferase [Holosporales bacterium]